MSRATLKPIVSELRESIIKGIAGKLEKYGFDEKGMITTSKPLSEHDEIIKNNLEALFEAREIYNTERYIEFIHNTSRTFSHILICFKLMEKREIMNSLLNKVIGTEIYSEILPDFNSINSIAYDEFTGKYNEKIDELSRSDNLEEDLEYYEFLTLIEVLASEMAEDVPLLFKEYEYNLVQPDFNDLKEIMRIISKIPNEEYFEDDFLGWIYQYWVDTDDSEIEEGENERHVSYANNIYFQVLKVLDSEQTEFGEFYTPRWVVKNVVDNTIQIFKEKSDKDIEQIRLLDPACGAGNFLVYAFDALMEIYNQEHSEWSEEKKISTILEKNIYGIDVQREPLQITALNLWIKAKSYIVNAQIDRLNLFNVNVLMANSLFPWETEEEYRQITIWDTPETLAIQKYTSEDIGRLISNRNEWNKNNAIQIFKNKFDIVIMNPPFVDARKMSEEALDLLKTYYPDNARNLFGAFIVRAVDVLDKKGVLGFISSDSYFTISSFQKLRSKLLQYTIEEVDLLGIDVFDGPAVSASLMFVVKDKSKKNIIKVIDKRNKDFKIVDTKEMEQSVFSKIPGNPFIFELSDKFIRILSGKTIDDYNNLFEVRKGIVTSGNDKYLRRIWDVPRERIGKDFLLYNKDIESIKYPISWVIDCRKEKLEEMLSNSSSRLAYLLDNYNFNTGENTYKQGVLFSLTGNLKTCLLDRQLFDVSFPAILCKREEDIYFVLALMLSRFSNYCLGLLNSTMHTTPGDVRRLPFVFPEVKLRDEINGIVDKLVTIKNESIKFNPISEYFVESELEECFNLGAKSFEEALHMYFAKVNEMTTEAEMLFSELDKKIYELYGLNKQDIEVVENATKENAVDFFEKDEQMLIIKYLQNRVFKNVEGTKKLFLLEDIVQIISADFERLFDEGYKMYEEAFALLNSDVISLILNQTKIGAKKIVFFDIGTGTTFFPWLKGKVLAGKGKNAQVVFWCGSDFMIEFDENSRYGLQNEIRRLTNEVYIPKLQRIMEKNQSKSLTSVEEKNASVLTDSVKCLENWKVVD